ncbi:MAG TPA: ELM1/GtrOC1 family putative glycosyltransferase [Alphaproteobacteria bacterium]|nr:ELM1/GtrOC1 family putative glycosyltransferase [Alphaproteobacteria bacterium]
MGDNAQVLAILGTLALPWETKRLYVQPQWRLGKPPFAINLDHLDLARSDPLNPPWPDLVITSGRRMAMAALWVKEQSGGRTKIAYIGRPRRWIERFDLVIGTAQYRLPNTPNVLKLDLPLMRPDREAVAAAGRTWAPRLSGLARPLIAVLVGGRTKPYRLDANVARDLLAAAERERRRSGGSLYVTTSRRTGPEAADAIERGLPDGARLFRWRPEAAGDNPYLGLLALADAFIVTGDSASMMVEVARLSRPLSIFPLPVGVSLIERPLYALGRLLHPSTEANRRWWSGFLGPLGDFLYDTVGLPYSRDLTMLHEALIRRGMASRVGERVPHPATGTSEIEDELSVAAMRIRRLLPTA